MTDEKRFSIIKPDLNTPFHIDFIWWKDHDSNWRVHLFSCLCQKHQEELADADNEIKLDWVDPETAEVKIVDGLQHILINHCAQQPDFLTDNTSLVNAAFRVFLASGNRPMTPVQLSEKTGKPAEMILRTLSGIQVYKGLRPCRG